MVQAAKNEHMAWHQHVVHVDARHIDVMGHVNNLVYLKWMEEADIEHMKAQGLTFELYQAVNCGLVVRQRTLDYLAAAYPGDVLVVHTGSQLLDALRLRRVYEVVTQRQPDHAPEPHARAWRQRTRGLLVRGESLWVAVDMHSRKPRRMPPELMEAVQR